MSFFIYYLLFAVLIIIYVCTNAAKLHILDCLCNIHIRI